MKSKKGSNAFNIVIRELKKMIPKKVIKKKRHKDLTHPYINPRQLRNFIYGNTLEDWLDKYRKPSKFTGSTVRSACDAHRMLIHDYIVEKLSSLTDETVHRGNRPARDTKDKDYNGQVTLEHMQKGRAVIMDAVIVSRTLGVYDTCDFLVRSDLISYLFPGIDEYIPYLPVSSFNDWGYYSLGVNDQANVISKGVPGSSSTLKNTYNQKYWKTRLYMQSLVLEQYQHIRPTLSFLVDCTSPGRPGLVMFDDGDEMIPDVYSTGKKWLARLHEQKKAKKWKVSPRPSVPELYANAKLTRVDTRRYSAIHKIASEQDNTSQLYGCAIRKSGLKLSTLASRSNLGITGPCSKLSGRFLKKTKTSKEAYQSFVDKLPVEYTVLELDSLLDKEGTIELSSTLAENKDTSICHWGTDVLSLLKYCGTVHDTPIYTDNIERFLDIKALMITHEITLPGTYGYSLYTIHKAVAGAVKGTKGAVSTGLLHAVIEGLKIKSLSK